MSDNKKRPLELKRDYDGEDCTEHGLEHRIFGWVESLRSDDGMEDLQREVPHRKDDDDSDQACQDEDNDLLEPFVKREEHPFSADPSQSDLPLHFRILPREATERAIRPPRKIPMNKRNDRGTFTHRRGQAL